jgi:hypothetical protein
MFDQKLLELIVAFFYNIFSNFILKFLPVFLAFLSRFFLFLLIRYNNCLLCLFKVFLLDFHCFFVNLFGAKMFQDFDPERTKSMQRRRNVDDSRVTVRGFHPIAVHKLFSDGDKTEKLIYIFVVAVGVKDQLSLYSLDRHFNAIVFLDINRMLSLTAGHKQAGVI